MLTLYGYPLSSAAYRVRIALALKGVRVSTVNKQLRRGEHRQKDYLKINPQGFVPVLTLEDGTVLTQSLAIIEWLEESHPRPALLPAHPRVLQYLESTLNVAQAARDEWYRHWVATGFAAFEELLSRDASRGRFCFGDQPGMADVCLVPQIYNARRYSVDLTPYPRIVAIDAACGELPAFAGAAPEKQV